MTSARPISRLRRPARAAILLAALLAVVLTGPAAGRDAPIVRARMPATPMVLQNVGIEDLVANTHGICNGEFTHVIKNAAGANNAVNYLNAATTCGVKVVFFFPETADHAKGVVYPSRVAYWANLVKNHPSLWGYLTVKEPSWSGIGAAEIRSLYSAFKSADPKHPVIALFGDAPHFGDAANPYTAGMADIVMIDWYPVETTNGTNSIYLTTGPKWFAKVAGVVGSRTPTAPTWLMVQTHKYLAPVTHKKQRPTEAQLQRQVSDGLTYLRARGIAFHTWTNTSYNTDQRRDPTMVEWMKRIARSFQFPARS